jgi:hypothetical protein
MVVSVCNQALLEQLYIAPVEVEVEALPPTTRQEVTAAGERVPIHRIPGQLKGCQILVVAGVAPAERLAQLLVALAL